MFGFKRSFEQRVKALETAIGLTTAQVARLQEDLMDLAEKHVSLRGAVYQAKLHKQPIVEETSPPKPTVLTRDALRAQSGFQPGRPMVHK